MKTNFLGSDTVPRKMLTAVSVLAVAGATFATRAFSDVGSEPEKCGGIRIGIIGDQTGTADLDSAYDILQDGVDILANEEVDVVIHVGDLLESSAAPADIEMQWDSATTVLDTLPVDWYMVAGDHDVNPPGYQQDSSDRSREVLWQSLYGARMPQAAATPWYSFDAGDYHFIMLYSHQALHADPRWGNIFLARLYDDQISFLKQDLKANANAKATIVVVHQPLWYHWSGWEPVHNLLKKYHVAAVISGHFHYDQEMKSIDGIRYLTVGATGGMVKQGARDAGNVHHVSVMELRGRHIADFELLPISDTLPLAITPRLDMDRVQAMDVVLGELWNFASLNPLFLKDGGLVNSCDSVDPAVLSVASIGNPTDETMDVQLDVSSNAPEINVIDAGFLPGQCTVEINDYECELARSARMFISNYSSIMVNTYGPPLWEANLVIAGTPAPGASVSVSFRLAFNSAQGELFLNRTVDIPVGVCP